MRLTFTVRGHHDIPIRVYGPTNSMSLSCLIQPHSSDPYLAWPFNLPPIKDSILVKKWWLLLIFREVLNNQVKKVWLELMPHVLFVYFGCRVKLFNDFQSVRCNILTQLQEIVDIFLRNLLHLFWVAQMEA